MTTKDQVLADIKDLVTTFIRKTIELRDNPDLRDKWKAKNKKGYGGKYLMEFLKS